MIRKPTLTALILIAAAILPAGLVTGAGPVSIRLTVKGKQLEGNPIHWTKTNVLLLGRDGYLWEFDPNNAKNFNSPPVEFRPYGYTEMRTALMTEFGRGFEVSGTGHYIVVHPAGQRDVWADRFEELYRSFRHYFIQRGFQLHEPQFPLVAVVFGSRQDFDRYAVRDGQAVGNNVLGYYSVESNRVAMYDIDDGASSTEWGQSQNAATIIHEATHQTAFNTGIHSRYGVTPRWLGEGLGTMFEANGVWNSMRYTKLEDRINNGRLHGYRQYQSRRRSGALAEMIASDRIFQADAAGAYAEAWATAFYLSERETARFAEYVALVSARPSFENYTQQQRLADFQQVFGEDLRMMETRIQRFIDELP